MFFVIILTELAISNRTLDNEQPDSQPFVVGFNVLIVTNLNEKKYRPSNSHKEQTLPVSTKPKLGGDIVNKLFVSDSSAHPALFFESATLYFCLFYFKQSGQMFFNLTVVAKQLNAQTSGACCRRV